MYATVCLIEEQADLFSTQKLPKAGHFQRAFFELQIFYERRFGVVVPPLNSPLILYRHIKRLAIPGKRNLPV